MSKTRQPVDWSRLVIEGLVIVVSILMAFAIDAWWEERRELHEEVLNLTLVAAEISANSERIDNKLQTIHHTIEATSTFISWMGPRPANVDAETVVKQWDKLFGVGFFALQRSATEAYMATGQLEAAETAEVRRAIADWYSSGTRLEHQYERLRAAHANTSDYLQDAIPILHTIGINQVMSGHPASQFPFDLTAFLADPKLESRLAMYLIRMEFVSGQATRLKQRQVELVDLIEETIRSIE